LCSLSRSNKLPHTILAIGKRKKIWKIAFQNEVEMNNHSFDYNQNRTVSPTYGRSSYNEKSINNHIGNSLTRRSMPITSTPNEEMVSFVILFENGYCNSRGWSGTLAVLACLSLSLKLKYLKDKKSNSKFHMGINLSVT
jgi:hypothetical protein